MPHHQDVQKQHSKKVDFRNSTWDALFHPDLCTHDFDRMHACCPTGAVYIEDSNASFGGETTFSNNTAENGGAIYSSESWVFVGTGTRFMFNVATTGSGGGVYASESVMSLNGPVFTENNGVQGGGWSQLMLW
ncbi:unnamed protein product [Ascophyllum nodosum]